MASRDFWGGRMPWWVWRGIGLSLLLGAVAVAAALTYVVGWRANHVGWDPRWAWPLAVMLIAYGGCNVLSRGVDGWTVACLVAGVALGLMLYMVDHYNLVVEYGEWCARGLPEPWAR